MRKILKIVAVLTLSLAFLTAVFGQYVSNYDWLQSGDQPAPPDACFSISTNPQEVGEPVEFDPSCSSSGRTIEEYNWDLDISTEERENDDIITETYNSEGEYSIELEIVDANGRTDTSENTLNIVDDREDPPPPPEPIYRYQDRGVNYGGYSQQYIYDLQSSYQSEDGRPGKDGPSLFFGAEARYFNEGYEDFGDFGNEDLGESVYSYFIDGDGDTWGAGNLYHAEYFEEDRTVSSRDSYQGQVVPPHPDADEDQNRCGDSNRNLQDEDGAEAWCPEDYGLPANEYSGGGQTEATTTLTHNLPTVNPESLNNGDVSHEDNGNYVIQNDFLMTVQEFGGSETYDWEEGSTGGSTLDIQSWDGKPAFIIDSPNQIRAKVPSYTVKSFDITDYTSEYDGTTWEINENDHDVYQDNLDSSEYTDCSGDDQYSSCSIDSTFSACTDVDTSSGSEVTEYSYDHRSESVTVGDVLEEYEVIDSSGGESTSSNFLDVDITVEWSETESSGSGYYESCNTEEDFVDSTTCEADASCSDFDNDETGCEDAPGCNTEDEQVFDSCEGTEDYCSTLDESTCSADQACFPTYEDEFDSCSGSIETSCSLEDEKDYEQTSEQSIDSSRSSSSPTDISYEKVDWEEPLVFSLDKTEEGDGEVNDNIESILFDNNLDRSIGGINYLVDGGTYFSYEVDKPEDRFGNSHSVSVSEFNVGEDNGDFISVRNQFEAFNVDGPRGMGDGYVAVQHDVENAGSASESRSDSISVVGSSREFAEREVTNSYSSGVLNMMSNFFFGTDSTSTSASFVDENQVESMLQDDNFECPGDSLTCVADITFYLDNLEDWNQLNPSSGVNFDHESVSTTSSLSTCRQFEEMSPSRLLDDERSVQCTYEYSDGVSDRSAEIDPYDAHDAGTRWHTMEGPEVDESTMRNSDWNRTQDDYESKVGYSECVLHGEPVPEGTTANIAYDLTEQNEFDEYPGYESPGDSPDEEVCLNRPDPDYHNFGGQWYDLDDSRATEYVRNELETDDARTSSDAEGVEVDESELEGTLDSDDWIEYWHVHPNQQAEDVAFENAEYILDNRGGFNLEEDCVSDCADNSLGQPYYGPFIHGSFIDDYSEDSGWDVNLETQHLRVTVDGNRGIGSSNTQQEQTEEDLGPFDNSQIDPENDQWALAPDETYGVGPYGSPYEPGQCYGADREDGVDKPKSEAVYANSYLDSDQGWIDPDDTLSSATSGGLSCDLTGNDWGYGYDDGGDTITCIQGGPNDNCEEYDPDNPHVVVGDVRFKEDADNLYGDACGDDPGEYLISAYGDGSYDPDRDEADGDHYACTDQLSDCVFAGEIYEEGSTLDIGSIAPEEEEGGWSQDEEVCLNIDDETPGGTWYDVDEWQSTEYIRSRMSDAGINDVTDSSSPDEYELVESQVEGLLDSDDWIEYWRVHKNQEAVSEDDDLEDPNWFTFQTDTVAVESEVKDDRGGFALETQCTINSVQNECQDIDDPVNDRFWADFSHAARSDDYYHGNELVDVNLTVYHNRMMVGGEMGVGASNIQDQETDNIISDEFHDSRVDSEFDQWAYTRELEMGIGPFGNVYEPGQCYGIDREQGENLDKTQRIFANSFLDGSEDITGDGEDDGNWVDPDDTSLSAIQGGLSCDLTGDDWGYGYNSGTGTELNCVDGDCRGEIGENGFDDSDPVTVEGDVSFDLAYEENPEGINPLEDNDGYQPNACGDDPSEYLIREHSAYEYGEEFQPNLERDNIYGCAPDPNHCVFDGEVYHEGQLVDISAAGTNEEAGEDINDPEICLNLNENIPGGTWYDIDNDWLREERVVNHLVNEHNLNQSDAETRWNYIRHFRDDRYWGENQEGTMMEAPEITGFDPDEDLARFEVTTSGSEWVQEETENLYEPEGYATQHYCYVNTSHSSQLTGNMQLCDDTGSTPYPDEGSVEATDQSPTDNNWFNPGNYSFSLDFDEGAKQDNFDQSLDIPGVNNKLLEDSDQFEPGAETEDNWEDVYGDGFEVDDLHTSTPGPEQWALTPDLTWLIGNDASIYRPGNCYYREGIDERDDIRDESQTKMDRVFGNSYADVQEIGGEMRGIWRDPDDLSDPSKLTIDCDLTGPDKGLGWDKNPDAGVGDPNDWQYYDEDGNAVGQDDSSHPYVVADDIAWEVEDGDNIEGFDQEPHVCGDDNKEYLLEEQGEAPNSPEQTGRWGCATDYTYCVSRAESDQSIYDHGSYTDTREDGEFETGRAKNDEEICELRTDEVGIDDVHGTWYDQDYTQDYCRENDLWGRIGKQWISSDYINDHPLAVEGGLDDSWNEYLSDQNRDYLISDPTAAEFNSTHTPVPTGTNHDKVAVPNGDIDEYGFCAGDDDSEYVIFQESNTMNLESDQSVVGVSKDPESCVLDNSRLENIDEDDLEHESLSSAELQDERMIYQEGDTIRFESGDTERTIACFDGQWWGDWPIVFLEDTEEFDLGETGFISFLVINPTDSSKDMELELNPRANDDDDREELAQMTSFEPTGTDEMEFTVPASSSTIQRLEVNANREVDTTSETGYDLEVFGISSDGSLSGADQVDLLIEEDEDLVGTSSQTRGIPGLTAVQLAVIALMSSVIFFFSN